MELRHLRYFTAVVQWNGYREAARRRHVAQPALSQAVSELEEELGVKLFLREKRRARLTPEGEVFYTEAVRVLAQAQHAIDAARRASRGEIGTLRIGFLGSATASFLPGLVRLYRQRYPGVKLVLEELTPQQQEEAFARGTLDIGFTRPLPKRPGATLRDTIALQRALTSCHAGPLRTENEERCTKELRWQAAHSVSSPRCSRAL